MGMGEGRESGTVRRDEAEPQAGAVVRERDVDEPRRQIAAWLVWWFDWGADGVAAGAHQIEDAQDVQVHAVGRYLGDGAA